MNPVICNLPGDAVAGGSDIALYIDLTIMAENAEIGYMPAKVRGSPAAAMCAYRLGAEKVKRMLSTGDKTNGRVVDGIGLILKTPQQDQHDDGIQAMTQRMYSAPVNLLAHVKTCNQSGHRIHRHD